MVDDLDRYSFKRFFLLCIFFSSSIGLVDSGLQYYIILTVFFVSILFFNNGKARFTSFVDLIPLIMFFSWIYGVFIATLKGVDPGNVFRNFFAMTLYLFYYFFVFYDFNKMILCKVFFYSAFFNVLWAVWYFFVWYFNGASVNFDNDEGLSYSSLFRSYYSAGIMIIFPFLSCLLFSRLSGQYSIFKTKDGFFKYFLIPYFFCFFAIVITTFSKGFILAFFLLHVGLFFALILRSFFGRKKYIWVWLVSFSLCVSLGGGLFLSDIGKNIRYMYSSDEPSNSTRSVQRDYLVKEFTFEGAGLGASLKSGYKRDERGYGFETTYENIIHKFGFVSFFLFFSFLFPLFLSFKNLVFNRNVFYSSLAFGAMFYLIPSAGNPMLFSPILVLMHVSALIFLRRE